MIKLSQRQGWQHKPDDLEIHYLRTVILFEDSPDSVIEELIGLPVIKEEGRVMWEVRAQVVSPSVCLLLQLFVVHSHLSLGSKRPKVFSFFLFCLFVSFLLWSFCSLFLTACFHIFTPPFFSLPSFCLPHYLFWFYWFLERGRHEGAMNGETEEGRGD